MLRALLLSIYTLFAGFAYAASKPNVWIYTDFTDPTDLRSGGHPKSDPDDIVSLASLLLSADRFHVESIVLGSGSFPNMKNPLPFIETVFVPAYKDHARKLNAKGASYQSEIDFQWSFITRTGKLRLFDQGNDYTDLSDYETASSLVDYARDNEVYVLVWGALTEPAVVVKHLVGTGQQDALDNITFINHWGKSFVQSMHMEALKADPFKVTNCNLDRSACLYIHEQAKAGKVKLIQMGSVGQTGIVEGSKGYSRLNEFSNSRLGQILMSAKFYSQKLDQSDASTYWLLAEDIGFSLDDYPHNGALSEDIELRNLAKFKALAPKIMDDLLTRSNAASGDPYPRSFIAEYFTYAYYRWGRYNVYSPYNDIPFRILSPDGAVLKEGELKRAINGFDLPQRAQGHYRVKVDYGDKTIFKQM